MRKLIKTFLFVLISFSAFSQPALQVIRGKVLNQSSFKGISATIIINSNPEKSVTTDSLGNYKFSEIAPGKYSLLFSSEGFHTSLMENVIVISGKETVLDGALRSLGVSLETVTIKPDENDLNSIDLTVEQSEKFAASFYDPARVATTLPGVVNADDQANHIVVRGNSPNSLHWKLEGVEIVNPNHLDNAGTFSDRISMNGGGVNILSAQLLSTSKFHYAPYNSTQGNALAGIFDMRLRKGNTEKAEHTLQFSLLGIDLATEGPLTKKHNSSYLVNYRYSTIGLLSLMGVNFGNERINYQDLAFNTSFTQKSGGVFTIFGMGGKSFNNFLGQTDTSLREFAKDFQKINFFSDMGALGMTYKVSTGERSYFNSSICASSKYTFRKSENLESNVNFNEDEDLFAQTKIAFHGGFNYQLSAKAILKAGSYLSYNNYKLDSKINDYPIAKGTISGELIQPYLDLIIDVTEKINIETGLHSLYYTPTSSFSLEPRTAINYLIAKDQKLNVSYGIFSQLQLPHVYLTNVISPTGNTILPNENLDPTKCHYSSINHLMVLSKFQIKNEIFYQYLYDVPITRSYPTSFSALNLFNEFVSDTLTNGGTGESYGYEFTLKHNLPLMYFLLTASIYNSTYEGSDGIDRDSRYNGRYSFSLTTGKQWVSDKNDKNRIFSVNFRTVYRGGFREQDINYFNEGYPTILKDYIRFDLRLSVKKNKEKSTRTLALDIQNVSGQKNIAYNYFDRFQNSVLSKYQLGTIPVLSYRIEF